MVSSFKKWLVILGFAAMGISGSGYALQALPGVYQLNLNQHCAGTYGAQFSVNFFGNRVIDVDCIDNFGNRRELNFVQACKIQKGQNATAAFTNLMDNRSWYCAVPKIFVPIQTLQPNLFNYCALNYGQNFAPHLPLNATVYDWQCFDGVFQKFNVDANLACRQQFNTHLIGYFNINAPASLHCVIQ